MEENKQLIYDDMNELMINLKNGNRLYFKTTKNTAKTAFYDFLSTCEQIAVNTDNVVFESLVLRDKNGNDIDKLTRKEM